MPKHVISYSFNVEKYNFRLWNYSNFRLFAFLISPNFMAVILYWIFMIAAAAAVAAAHIILKRHLLFNCWQTNSLIRFQKILSNEWWIESLIHTRSLWFWHSHRASHFTHECVNIALKVLLSVGVKLLYGNHDQSKKKTHKVQINKLDRNKLNHIFSVPYNID